MGKNTPRKIVSYKKILVTDVESLRACKEVVEVHEDANTHIHESHKGRMAPTTNPTKFES